MEIYQYPERKSWEKIMERPYSDNTLLEKSIRKIMDKVKQKGDRALRRYAKEFDKVKLKKIAVSEKEIKDIGSKIDDGLKNAIQQAKKNIEIFHNTQREEVRKIETMPGITCWRKSVGIERIGLYIPGGSAPLFSTVLMLAVPARLAGCDEIILCTPPSATGEINPAILYTAQLCGITKIFKAGGAQAIAAMGYGTESIPKVFKIFGPGNQYVTLAKQLMQREGIAIDMPAGPSEVLVIADDTAIPEYVAADLLSQAEHGIDSQVMILTPSEVIGEKVMAALEDQIDKLPRQKIAKEALRNSSMVIVKDLDEAIAFSNRYAPEHLIIACADADSIAEKITSAGSVFLGNYSPESAGDYASGTNHTLPTNGYATAYSGVSLDSFVKKITYQRLTKQGLLNISATVMKMAESEGLQAHSNAVAIRLNDK